jgi:hypothetical protein
MEFENFKALRLGVWSWLSGIWRRALAAVDRGVIAAGRLLKKEFWFGLPERFRQMVWGGIMAAVHLLRRAFDAIALNRTFRRVVVGFLAITVVVWLVLLIAAFTPSREVAPSQPAYKIYYLDQGWGPNMASEDRQTFYYTSQGTSLMGTGFRYSWFINLEQNFSKKPFIDPGHMRALGFQVDGVPTAKNPDNLPVGLTRHFAPEFNDEVLDITCAACHTGELFVHVKGKTLPSGEVIPEEDAGIRIDGGQGMHAFTSTSPGQFGRDLTASLGDTLLDPFKFGRFARAVLGARYPAAAPKLYWEVAKVMGSLGGQTFDNWYHNRYPVTEGFGRVDAIGRIANAAFGTALDSSNFAPGNAPVSYPAIWGAHYWDWVQYGASVAQPMARNIGESLGVGATLELTDVYGRPLKDDEKFISGTLIRNLKTIEDMVAKLKAPEWPEDLLGPVDREKKADPGKVLFEQTCAHCHEPCLKPKYEVAAERPLLLKEYNPLLEEDQPLWRVNTVSVADIGTDPQAAMNFVNRRINLEKTGLTRQQVIDKIRPILEKQQARKIEAFKKYGGPDPGDGKAAIQRNLDAINLTSTSIGQALNYLDTFIADKYYKQLGISEGHVIPSDNELVTEEYDGEGALDTPEVKMVYKARPLGGVWATAPYLHNGSVPTLYDLLSPANERPRRFFIRNRMDFDPVRVGLVSSPASDKGFWMDTTIPGNRNTGHEFRGGYSTWTENGPPSHGVIGPEWTPEQRWQIIEYLKIYKENPQPCAAGTVTPQSAQVTTK